MDETFLYNDDYDTPWKNAVTRYFPEFMAFYFPDAHAQIDWAQPYTFLDQELAQVVQDAELGKRLIDRLVQVAISEGGEAWVYIHIEVQGGHDSQFAERMFTYFERSKIMPYVTSVERIGIEKGLQQGGFLLLRRLLVRRFGPLPLWAENRLAEAALAELEAWGDAVLDAKTLEEVFAAIPAEQ